jgi:DNA-binding response OmpR family regulator
MMGEPGLRPAATTVLVVEDDANVAEVLTRYLRREGYEVTCLDDGLAALELALADPPDLAVLDIMLPGMTGLELCRRLRAEMDVPIIMLTALGEEADRVVGLELGADDYVTKPFSPREVTARIKAILRRCSPGVVAAPEDSAPLVAGDITIDPRTREAEARGVPLTLTALEFDLLAFLARHPREVFTREQLLDHVWGFQVADSSTVTVHVRRLRQKLEADPGHPAHLKTVWGVGYRFEA